MHATAEFTQHVKQLVAASRGVGRTRLGAPTSEEGQPGRVGLVDDGRQQIGEAGRTVPAGQSGPPPLLAAGGVPIGSRARSFDLGVPHLRHQVRGEEAEGTHHDIGVHVTENATAPHHVVHEAVRVAGLLAGAEDGGVEHEAATEHADRGGDTTGGVEGSGCRHVGHYAPNRSAGPHSPVDREVRFGCR